MNHYVYVISSQKRKYIYVGLTNNISRRLLQHNGCRERTTKAYAPFHTLLIEGYENRPLARRREKYLKSGAGKEFLKRL